MINFIATRPVTPIPMCCLWFFVVEKIYHPNSDSKYVLGKVHLHFFWRGGGGGGRGVKAVMRTLEHFWRGVFFNGLSRAIYSFFYTPYISN